MTTTIEEVRGHISAVVGYNWPSEYADALENGPEGHIIEHLIALADFIGEPMSAGEQVRLYQVDEDERELSLVTVVIETDDPEGIDAKLVGGPVKGVVFSGPGDLVQHEESEGA